MVDDPEAQDEWMRRYQRTVKEEYARRRAELERRRHKRIDARVPVRFETPGDYLEAYTRNISKGGIYFETPERLSPNGRLELVLHPPGARREIKVIARVIRMFTRHIQQDDGTSRRVHGYGVRFEDLDGSSQKVLERFFNRWAKELEDPTGSSNTPPPDPEADP